MPTIGRVLAVLLALLMLPACAASPPAPVAPTLRVMTWNVQSLAHEPAEWAEVIARQRPDVLGVQEICTAEALELAAVLRRDHGLSYEVVPGPIRPPTPDEASAPINAALGPACDTPADAVEFGVAVLALSPITEAGVVTFPPDRRDEQRGYLTARVAGVRVLVTHVGLDGVQSDQIRRLAEAAAGTDPVVVMGDLNVAPDAPELAPLRAGLAEVDPEGRPTSLRGKIDYIYLRGLTVASGPDAPMTTASDHR
ncbi:MAG: endonuclease, partial [Actinomycetospora sp.]|nr:endonuclease [Actinomycetospora sp.]